MSEITQGPATDMQKTTKKSSVYAAAQLDTVVEDVAGEEIFELNDYEPTDPSEVIRKYMNYYKPADLWHIPIDVDPV